MIPKELKKYARAFARLGGLATKGVTSERKAKSSAKNGRLGGRPKRYPPCQHYPTGIHRFLKRANGVKSCACGFVRPT